MDFDTPQWFKQRQIKAEELSPGQYKLTGPNLPEAVLGTRMAGNLCWQGFFKRTPDGPDVEATDARYELPRDALFAAFELYRRDVIV